MDHKMAQGFPHCTQTRCFEDLGPVSGESGEEKGHQPNPVFLKLQGALKKPFDPLLGFIIPSFENKNTQGRVRGIGGFEN